MRFILLYFFTLLSPCIIFSQNIKEIEENIDSYNGEELLFNLEKLIEHYQKINPEKVIKFSKLMFNKSSNDLDFQCKSLIFTGDAYFDKSDFNNSIKYYLQVLNIYESNNEISNSAIIQNKISSSYFSLGNYNKAVEFNSKSYNYFKKNKDINSCAFVLNEIGDAYLNLSNTNQAFINYNNALDLYIKLEDNRGIVITYNKLANANSKFGNFIKSKNYLVKALEIAKRHSYDKEIKMLERNLTIVDRSIQNYSNSQTEFSKIQNQEKNKKILDLSKKNSLSIEEISKLSQENQLKEFKLKAQNDELLKKKLVDDIRIKQNLYLVKEKENLKLHTDLLLNREKFIVIFFSFFSIVLIIIIILVFKNYRDNKIYNQFLELKNTEINSQKDIIEYKNILLNDGLTYAKNIQQLILPTDFELKKYFNEYFLFNQPKDFVSGDFYWLHDAGNKCYFVVADCTGHGVSGAFVSFIANNILNNIVSFNSDISPSQILQELNKRIIQVFKQTDESRSVKYGLDIALIVYDREHLILDYSGARIPLVLIRNNTMIMIAANNFSVGNSLLNNKNEFTDKKVQLFKDDRIYLATDGFADQKGGENNRKLFSKTFRELLLLTSSNDIYRQEMLIKKYFTDWKGDNSQTDDVLVFGFCV